jgi:hypothetical protein
MYEQVKLTAFNKMKIYLSFKIRKYTSGQLIYKLNNIQVFENEQIL